MTHGGGHRLSRRDGFAKEKYNDSHEYLLHSAEHRAQSSVRGCVSHSQVLEKMENVTCKSHENSASRRERIIGSPTEGTRLKTRRCCGVTGIWRILVILLVITAAEAGSFTTKNISQSTPVAGAKNRLTVVLMTDLDLHEGTTVTISGIAVCHLRRVNGYLICIACNIF